MRGELANRLTKAIEDLPEQERLVITLYHYEELTRNEISLLLGIDGTRVSQIRASAVLHLRSALSDLSRKVETKLTRIRCNDAKKPQRASFARVAA
jgi:RNA polymerase sigma factor for flagellar operon FliA